MKTCLKPIELQNQALQNAKLCRKWKWRSVTEILGIVREQSASAVMSIWTESKLVLLTASALETKRASTTTNNKNENLAESESDKEILLVVWEQSASVSDVEQVGLHTAQGTEQALTIKGRAHIT